MPPPKPAIFLDRDGTINADTGYTYRKGDLMLIDGVAAGIAEARRAGIPVFIVTNQGGIALGLYSEAAMHAFNRHLLARLIATDADAVITDIAFCPHHPEADDPSRRQCDCRKPQPGMLRALAAKHGLDLAKSMMIGDRDTDVAAAEAAGCKGVLYIGDGASGDVGEGVGENNSGEDMLALLRDAIAWGKG